MANEGGGRSWDTERGTSISRTGVRQGRGRKCHGRKVRERVLSQVEGDGLRVDSMDTEGRGQRLGSLGGQNGQRESREAPKDFRVPKFIRAVF